MMHLKTIIQDSVQTAIQRIDGLAQYLTIMDTQIAFLVIPAMHHLITIQVSVRTATIRMGGLAQDSIMMD